jgi:hypothetical protein
MCLSRQEEDDGDKVRHAEHFPEDALAAAADSNAVSSGTRRANSTAPFPSFRYWPMEHLVVCQAQ